MYTAQCPLLSTKHKSPRLYGTLESHRTITMPTQPISSSQLKTPVTPSLSHPYKYLQSQLRARSPTPQAPPPPPVPPRKPSTPPGCYLSLCRSRPRRNTPVSSTPPQQQQYVRQQSPLANTACYPRCRSRTAWRPPGLGRPVQGVSPPGPAPFVILRRSRFTVK